MRICLVLVLLVPCGATAQSLLRGASIARSIPNNNHVIAQPTGPGLSVLRLPVRGSLRFAQDDTLAAVQSDNAFNTLEDGQPDDPGQFEIQPDLAWQDLPDNDDPVQAAVELQYTLPGKRLSNLQLQLTMTATTDGDLGDLTPTWQHRWVADARRMLSVSSLLEIDIPVDSDDSDVDGTLTGIVVKSFGANSFYWNGIVSAAEGEGLDGWGFRLGYKSPIAKKTFVIVDYVFQDQTDGPVQNVLELSAEYDVSGSFSIGPGILAGLDRNNDTPRFGADVRVVVSF